MDFLRKLFKSFQESQSDKINDQKVNLSLDDSFVHHFINKGGKFLYCTTIEEVINNLSNILIENNWNNLICYDYDLLKLFEKLSIKPKNKFNSELPFFTNCEHLIANNGDILFSSNQLGSNRLSNYSENFIVYGTTSQLVKNISQGLTGIKVNFKGNIPTNISSISSYKSKKTENDFMSYGNNNSKNLYLLLFEDL